MIAIGDELTTGQRLDTNSQWLSQKLGDLGVKTIRHSTVCDDMAGNVEAFRLAAQRADVVVCTGGLGPTLDDLTRQAMASAFELELELDQTSLDRIRAMFAGRNREMPERNRIQAMFPVGSRVIENPHGSAPGIDLTVEGESPSRIFALPGVPAEMKQMWDESVGPRIDEHIGGEAGNYRYRVIKFFGIGESDVEVRMPDLIQRDRIPSVGITVSRATLTLRIAARARTDEEFEQLIQPTLEEIESALGDLIFGGGTDELQDAVARLLDAKSKSFASLEIGACSLLPDWLAASDAGQQHFLGGLAVPNWPLAKRWLEAGDVKFDDEGIKEIARLYLERAGTDLVLVVGEFPTLAEIEGATKPFDTFYAVASSDGTVELVRKAMGGHPDVLGPRIAKTGLDVVRRILAGLPLP